MRKPKMITDQEIENLSAAFERVSNPFDWKSPINALIPASDRRVIARAIEFFTATEAKFVALSPDTLHVTAAGYRAGPAGDN